MSHPHRRRRQRVRLTDPRPEQENDSPPPARGPSKTTLQKKQRARSLSDWTGALHGAGLRRTGPRIAVLEQLDAADAPLTHGELVEMLAHLAYDRATLYRNLVDLVGAGLVTREDLGHLWRFELVRREGRGHGSEHPHFLCNECGEVSCLPQGVVRVVPIRDGPRALREKRVEVQIKGRCDACAH
jgi:Fur family ferric uptake transcriptional regulator